MKTVITLTATSLLIAFAPFSNALADAKPATTGHIGVGLNLTSNPMIYKALDNNARAGLHLQYRGERFNVTQDALSYRFLNRDNFHIEALVKSESRGFDIEDFTELEGMSNREDSLDFGLRTGFKTAYGVLSLDATTDISDTHKGHEADLRFGPDFYSESPSANSSFGLGLVAGVKWQSDEVVDYYYGVKNSEATASRAAYEGKAAITPYIGIDGKANITKKITLTGSVLYMDQPDEITGSPLVDDGHDVVVNAGLTYWFK
jgi:outer membrane protein